MPVLGFYDFPVFEGSLVELPLVPGGKLFLHMLQSFDKVLVRGLIMAHDTGDPHIAVLPDGIQNADFFHFGHLPVPPWIMPWWTYRRSFSPL